MAPVPPLSRVYSLFDHVHPEWWRDAFNDLYLETDWDCVDDPVVTDAECERILGIPSVKMLFQGIPAPITNGNGIASSDANASERSGAARVRVLDLCCGNGRHSLALATRYPSVEFHGMDQSEFLIQLARDSALAQGCSNVQFCLADARNVSAEDASFDLVLVMGNSFGYGNDQDNEKMVSEIGRVLKPGGTVVIDHTDGSPMKSAMGPGGWEWLGSVVTDEANGATEKKPKTKKRGLIAFRERELSKDGKRLASREIVLDLGGCVCQNLFYSVRLYNAQELEALFASHGMAFDRNENGRLQGPDNSGDPGMMDSRRLAVAQKGLAMTSEKLDSQDAGLYVHPHLFHSHDPRKGRSLRMRAAVPAGTIIMADPPYAAVPEVTGPGSLAFCSNQKCLQRIPQDHPGMVRCPEKCIDDVLWCSQTCQVTDGTRHAFECAWLKAKGQELREREGGYDFAMIWVVVRILAARHLELHGSSHHDKLRWEDRFPRGWRAVDLLLGNRDKWLDEQLDHWRRLVDSYLCDPNLLTDVPSADEIVSIICKEETNSFCLFDGGPSGLYPMPDPPKPRGEEYGLALYTRGCMINHSCCPNVSVETVMSKALRGRC